MFNYCIVFVLGLLYTNVSSEFYYPDCEYSGMSCLDCYTQKLCINFFGLVHWSDTSCSSDVSGYANPYCDPTTDKCTNVRPDGCKSASYLKCIREGRYPEISDCTTYYECSNSTIDLVTCASNFVYSQEYGKCVSKMADSDCVQIDACGLVDSVEQYPTDPSLYYSCTASKLSLSACAESEIYNTTTNLCESKCVSTGLVPLAQNCSRYFSCQEIDEQLVAVEEKCKDGYGFNPNSLKCESGYENLCNELSLLENDIYDLISKIPIIRKLSGLIQKIFRLLSLNPAKILLIFRFPEERMSTLILLLDYIYKNKNLPSTTISLIITYVYDYLPVQVQFVINLLSQIGIIKLEATSTDNRVERSVSDFEQPSLDSYLQDVLSNIEIDIVAIIKNIEGKNATQLSNDIFQQLVKILKIPEDRISLFASVLKDNMANIANFLNTYIGWSVFIGDIDGTLRIDVGMIDKAFDDILKIVTPILYPNNYFLSKIFQVTAKRQYSSHHQEIIALIDNSYFSLNDI